MYEAKSGTPKEVAAHLNKEKSEGKKIEVINTNMVLSVSGTPIMSVLYKTSA